MCVRPVKQEIGFADKWEPVYVPCGKCWACIKNKEFDFVGRTMCEASVSDWAVALTLTYDDLLLDKPNQTRMLYKEDWAGFRNRLRKYTTFRGIYCGEFGKAKGRAHWHTLLFGNGTPPEPLLQLKNKEYAYMRKTNTKSKRPLWPYGMVYTDWGHSEKKVRYISKYLTKALRRPSDHKKDKLLSEVVGWSKRPIMGEAVVLRYAERQAAMKVWPRSFNYIPPGVKPKKWRYTFQGAAQFLYLDHMLSLWPEGHAAPKSEWMENAYRRYTAYTYEQAYKKLLKTFPPACLPLAVAVRNAKTNPTLLNHYSEQPEKNLEFEIMRAKWLDGQQEAATDATIRHQGPLGARDRLGHPNEKPAKPLRRFKERFV